MSLPVLPNLRSRPAGRPRLRRVSPRIEILVALGVGVVIAALGTLRQALGTFAYYQGDQFDQIVPLWHLVGQRLREGQWTGMDPTLWMGGNYAGEALVGLFNPVTLATAVGISFFDNLALAAAVLSIGYLALLGIGVHLLARSYGARRAAAFAVGVALPFSGFTLWYEAAGWPYHLSALTWVVFTWWAANRTVRGRMNPLPAFVFGALAMTTGSPFGALGVVVVLAALAVESLLRRRTRTFATLVVVGLCIAASALPVYLPLLSTSSVTWRSGIAAIANDTFLVPSLGDLAGASTPSFLPAMTQWSGPLESRPDTYLAWFVIPLLPWLRWGRLRRRIPLLTAPLIVAGTFLLLTLGPSNFWLFRWPIRMIDYLYLALLVLFAVALSTGLARDRMRVRAWASAVLIVFGAYLAWAVHPTGLGKWHLIGLAVVAAGIWIVITRVRNRTDARLGVVLVAGSAVVLALQSLSFPYLPGAAAQQPPFDLTRIRETTADYQGAVLQIADAAGVTGTEVQNGDFLFGNVPQAAGYEALGSYTGIGFSDFASAMCMNYRGETCAGLWDRLWEPAGSGVDRALVDVLRVSTLVVDPGLVPAAASTPPTGWRTVVDTPDRVVLERVTPLPEGSRLSWASVSVTSARSDGGREIVDYTGSTEGSLVFARLDWPGYRATVDGESVPIEEGPVGLVRVDVPAGTHTVELSYSPPGWSLAVPALFAAFAVAVAHSVLWSFRRRRRVVRRAP